LRSVSLTAALIAILAMIASAQTAPTSRPSIDAQLEAIDAKSSQVKDLTAHFEQRKYSALLVKPLVTTGEVRSKASTMLWIGEAPESTRMRVTLERMQIYYVKQKLVEDYPIVGKLGSLAASPLPRLEALRERFLIESDAGEGFDVSADNAEPVAFKLTPREDEVKQYVGHIRVLLDASRGLVSTFELVDPDGERTTIAFTDVRVNGGIDDASLELGAPRDVKVVKPLEPGK
jgi:outer membrane lipoprotein-sorting protein